MSLPKPDDAQVDGDVFEGFMNAVAVYAMIGLIVLVILRMSGYI
jgi:hypothetical protein